MNDPLNIEPVTPMESNVEERKPEDTRPPWVRILESLRPSISQEKIIRTGKTETEVEVKGHLDF